jgi:serine/threonine protein phosphatase 1
MKYFLFSDVHGEYDALIASLQEAGFDALNKEHFLIGLGDYFDRGHQNLEVYNFIKKAADEGRGVFIRGNHDDMLIDFLERPIVNSLSNLRFNGLENTVLNFGEVVYKIDEFGNKTFDRPVGNTIDFFEGVKNEINIKRPELLAFVKSMRNHVMIGNNLITHAGLTNRFGTPVIDNWTHTLDMISSWSNILDVSLTYIFGHWHAYALNKKFNAKWENPHKFIYKNFIGIDAMTNATKIVTIHIIDSNQKI